jgi:hypothetical protein
VVSTLRYFRDEYLAHLAGHCPAGVCKPAAAAHGQAPAAPAAGPEVRP